MFTEINRIENDIENLAKFNATPGKGITRFSFTEEDRKARKYIKNEMQKAGLDVREDAVGNIIGKREGKDSSLPVIMVGSHFDSVKNGGMFDGPAGVAAGLETARVFKEKDLENNYPLEVIAMVEEEGGRFGSGLFGSRAMTGRLDREELYQNSDENGITTAEALSDFGFDPKDYKKARRFPDEIKAFFELHIEQGPVLETKNEEVGLVSNIVGITQYEVIIEGEADHAGTTPMDMRRDPLATTGAIFAEIERLALKAGEGTVATVGKVNTEPGAANIIPGIVKFSIDIRSRNEDKISCVSEGIKNFLVDNTKDKNISFKMVEKISVPPVKLPEYITQIMEEKGIEADISCLKMNSGAGHDAMIMTDIADVGLVFVPSRDGKSHCPEEWTDYKDLQKGIELVCRTVIDMACN
ncbi:MAG: Zn-dependent hydrolase [Halanaerobiales bacterium]